MCPHVCLQWNSLRHQQHNLAGSEEQTLRTYSFISLAHFFVTFIHVRLASDGKEGEVSAASASPGDEKKNTRQNTAYFLFA